MAASRYVECVVEKDTSHVFSEGKRATGSNAV